MQSNNSHDVVHREIPTVRSLIDSILCSVKTRHLFHAVRTACLPGIDVMTKWSSVFNTLKSAYNFCPLLNAVCNKDSGLTELLVPTVTGASVKNSRIFTVRYSTERQNGSLYIDGPF